MTVRRHRFSFKYNHKTINYNSYINGDFFEVKCIVLLGTLQGAGPTRAVSRFMPAGTAVIQGAPHWLAKPDGSDIPQFMSSYSKQAIDSVFSLTEHETLHVIAESQAAPGALIYTRKNPKKVHRISLLQPLGLNQPAFTGNNIQRVKIFRERIKDNLRQQFPAGLKDFGLLKNHARLIRYILTDSVRAKAAMQQYAAGLAHDAVNDLAAANVVTSVDIIVGQLDKIFPADEIAASLQREHIDVEKFIVVPNVPHSPSASRPGLALFTEAIG